MKRDRIITQYDGRDTTIPGHHLYRPKHGLSRDKAGIRSVERSSGCRFFRKSAPGTLYSGH